MFILGLLLNASRHKFLSLLYVMHTFPFGHYRDEFGKKFLLHASHVVVFNFPSDRRQYTYYLQQVFGIGAKKALSALDFGMYRWLHLQLFHLRVLLSCALGPTG